jgi:GGDEF domain-containing protein
MEGANPNNENIRLNLTAADLFGSEIFRLEETYSNRLQELYRQVKAGNIDDQRFIEESRLAADVRQKELPRVDGMTGVFDRSGFFRLLSLAKLSGIKKFRCTLSDMNFLKDHNKNLGEPQGGDLALVTFASVIKQVAEHRSALVFRTNESGGDDFLLVEVANEDNLPKTKATEASEEIATLLSSITPEEYYQAKFLGKPIVRFDNGQEIRLSAEDIEKLKSNPQLEKIIIPPSSHFSTFEIDINSDVIYKQLPNGEVVMDFNLVADKLRDAMFGVQTSKSEMYRNLNEKNPQGASYLARNGSKNG